MNSRAYIISLVFAVQLVAVSTRLAADQNTITGLLDGSSYSAQIVREDGSAAVYEPLIDKLLFQNGMFSSAVCARYNFKPSEYWVRRNGDAIEFLAELNSSTDGQMIWRGTVRNGDLEGTMRWIRKRWYRTIDVTHSIEGIVDTVDTPVEE